MTITYHAGRRIQGLSTDGELTPTKTIDFTSCNSGLPSGWVGANESGYGTAGQGFACDTETLKVTSNTADIHTNVTYDLNTNDGITVGSKWVLTWTSIITSYSANTNAGSQHSVYFGMTDGATVGEPVGSTEEAVVRFSPRSDTQAYQVAWIDNSTYNFSSNIASLGIHTKYHKLVYERGGTITHYIYNNSDYSDTPVTGSTGTNSHTNALNKIKFSQYVQGNNGTLIMKIDDVKFYNGVTSTTGVKPTNVQSGSRFEETDTRKIYYGAIPSITDSTLNSTDGTTGWDMTNAGSSISLDTSNNEVDFLAPTGAKSCYYDLGANISESWVLRFKMTWSGAGSNQPIYWIGVSNSQTIVSNSTSIKGAFIMFYGTSVYKIITSNNQRIDQSGSNNLSPSTTCDATPYWVEIIKNGSTDITVSIYPNSSYGTATATYTNNINLSGLRYMNGITYIQGSGTTGTFSDVKFYNGVTNTTDFVWTEEA